MNKKSTFEVVGQITVDAGCIQVGDPCYGESDYMDNLEELDTTGVALIPHNHSDQGNYGTCSKAVVVTSGFGDGVYDVLVKKCPHTGMVKELKIKFF